MYFNFLKLLKFFIQTQGNSFLY